jgi:regulator of protease activity HflC (stomatin/prohibitin superfamily)
MPPKDIRDAMEKQMRAERERREAILLAEGEKKSVVLKAEGIKESEILRAQAEKEAEILRAEAKKEAMIREAEGQAAAILKIQEATAQGLKLLKDVGMDEPLLKYKSYEAMVEVANGQATKIIVPSELQNLTTAGITFHETAPANNPKKKHAEVAPAAPVAPAATPVNNKQFLETLSK